MLVKSSEKSGVLFEFPKPIDAFCLRAADGVGQKKIRISKLLASVVDSVNLRNSNVFRSVHVFSGDITAQELTGDKFYQHHLDYMTLLTAMSASQGEDTFCVLGGQVPGSNGTLRQLKYQALEAKSKDVQNFIQKIRNAIRDRQKSFSSSDVFNRLIVQDASGRFSRPSFVFRSLKIASREWQKINADELARQVYQKKTIAEPIVPGWGIQGFRFSQSEKKYAKTLVYDWELQPPLSLTSLHIAFSDLKNKMEADGIVARDGIKFYFSCPYMAVAAVMQTTLLEVFPAANISLQEYIFGWSPIHNMVASLVSSAKQTVFIDFNAFPTVKALVMQKE